MPNVERFFAQLQPEPEDSENTPQPLSNYCSHPAIVILGDPGSGKTTSFAQSANTEPNAVFVPIRDFLTFQANRWEGKTLYLDGLDEQRAKNEDGRGALDRIRAKLDELKCPRFRLSCRAADWYGKSETERLSAVSPGGKVLVLRLEPLSDTDIITIARDELENPTDFLVQAQKRGIDPLLRNPQTLKLILKGVQGGVWPATRADLFQKACERLLQETNQEHLYAGHIPSERLLTAAGYLCAVHLCGGTRGFALNPQDGDEPYPHIGELRGDQEVLASAVRRRVFQADGPGRVTPIHRTVAEYLGAHFFAQRIREGYPLKRVLKFLTGDDGGTLAELRGIYAWLACLCEEEAATLIRRDPLGLVLYGDASKLSMSGKRMVIDCLRDLASKNPGFRGENWSPEPFGTLASPDMLPVLKAILSDKAESPHLLSCILDAIQHGYPLPILGDDLMIIVRDSARLEDARVAALDAYRHVCPADTGALRTLLEDIHDGKVLDESHRLRGKLLYRLYPTIIGPNDIGRYLVHPVGHHFNAYTRFVTHELVRRTKPQELPLLLTEIDAKKIVGSPHHLIWGDFFGNLALQLLQHLGESSPSAQLYEWLGKTLDQYGAPVADRGEYAAAIQSWLFSRITVVQGLFCHWLSVTPFEKPQVELNDFWRRLHSIAPPPGFHHWLLALAERESDPVRADFLFREAVQGSTVFRLEGGPTLEELFQFVERNTKFHAPLQAELCWDIQDWRREDAQRTRAKKHEDKAQRVLRVQRLSEQLDAIDSGAPTDALVHLAKAYFGLFYETDREAPPKDRLIAFTTSEIAAKALDGFLAALQRTDIPSPKMIGELETEGNHYAISFPILAGLDVLADRAFAEVLSLPESTLQSGLAFHYAIVSDQERQWVDPLINARPDLAAEALTAYWRPQLAKDSKNIKGLYELAHEVVMKPLAQRVSLVLLKEYPNVHESNLELLLHAALRNGDRQELLSCTQHVITHHTPLTDDNKSLWYAVAFALNHDCVKKELSAYIYGKSQQPAKILDFLCPSHGIISDTPYPLPVAALASLISMMGPIFRPRTLIEVGWVSLRGPEAASTSIQSLIHRVGKEPTYEASQVLAALQDDPGLSAWRTEIAYVLASQSRQRRELAFKYPTATQLVEALNQGRPANAADLQALVDSHLRAISEELRDGPTDGWKGMWNVDGYGKPTQPRPENLCRDRLLELLRPRLLPLGVTPEPEGQYAEDKRADIKAVFGSLNLPVEIKRHFHPDLWTAPHDQLKRLYARDPGAAGYGIYLVFWFGIEERPLPKPPSGTAEVCTPAQLEAALFGTLQSYEKESLEIIVIDCARLPTRPGKSNGTSS